ncbi:MAG: hypothetical protein EOO13_08495 [Chitinophagaceae bacterium]|nr:MAG: hypothetical protein EOO13_08495 [Chitinophagaceae bacterium]
MKPITTTFIASFLSFFCLTATASYFQEPLDKLLAKGPSLNIPSSVERASPTEDSSNNKIDNKYKNAVIRLKQQGQSIAAYAKANNYNAERVFLMDMTLPSGKNRFFVYNILKDEVEAASLVTHGFGSNKYENDDPLEFSNVPDSKKTSLGRYKIGKSYFGQFGLAYKLYGLDSTNDKAFARDIVLHSHKRVPEKETFPNYIIVSSGCPTVSPAFLTKLDNYIKQSKKPILLWVYN